QEGVRTSPEVAVANTHHDRSREHDSFEGTGELPHAHFIPSPESQPTRSHPGSALYASSDIALSVKWGLADYKWIAEERAGGRVTRTAVQAAR
ncbi:hypothetical protein C8Q74DRAFT_1174428, partial [Fomes fomentarius]